jgi:tetratricopeptide (TPR) repeat protein
MSFHLSAGLLGLLVMAFILGGVGSASAQFTCRAEVDRRSAVTGGTVVLTVTVEGVASGSVDFKLPDMPTAMVSGTSYSRSQTYSNGQSSVTIAKIFYLTVGVAGEFVIEPVVVTDGGRSCETDPIKIEVTNVGNAIPPSVSGNRVPNPARSNGKPDAGNTAPGGQSGDDIFITLEVDRESVWVNQQVILTFRYFHRVNPWNQPQFTPPRTPGFWRENLGPQQEYRTTVGGRAYNVTEIRYAVFPTRAGELSIEPAELSFPDQGLDRFFSSRRRRGPRTLRTDPISIEVKELPAGKPEDFSGLVAREVRLTAQANLESVPRGEAIDFKIQLVSDAFLKGFEGLTVPPLADARIHDAGDDFRTKTEQNRLWGQVTLEKVIVPEKEGRMEMPRVALSWFDVRTGRYRTTNAAIGSVMVTPSDHPYNEQEDSGFLRSEVSRLGQDLVFIHSVPHKIQMGRRVLVASPLWWVGVLLPLVLLGFWRVLLLRRLADPDLLKKQNALIRAKALMDQEDNPEAPSPSERMARAITGFVADCTNVSRASVGGAEVLAFCQGHKSSEEGLRLAGILEECDTTRYGGAGLDDVPGPVFSEVKEILSGLHQRELSVSKSSSHRINSTLPVLILTLLLGIAADANSATDPARLMAEGNQAYTEGNVEMALELYRQAETLGAHDPDLFFNLGNAHARRGDLGYAVVNYLRAQRLSPNDQDIKDNLAWVRGNIADLELDDSELPLFISQAVAVVFSLTLGQWAMIFLVLVWGFCGLVAYQWKLGKLSDNLRRLVLVTGSSVLILAGIVFWRWRVEEVVQTAVVVVEEVAVRSGPDTTFPVQFMVHDGLTIQIQEERVQWVRISLGGESLGWMPMPSVEMVRRENLKQVN